MRIPIIKIEFQEHIPPSEIQWFRGVIINLSGHNQLFHNHMDEGFKYVYPKVQYKLIDGRAAVTGIGESVPYLRFLFSGISILPCKMGNRFRNLHIASIEEREEEVGLTDCFHTYRIENWLPLNSRNYKDYCDAEGLIARMVMLEKILTGNILSFAKGIGLFFDSKISCVIEDLHATGNMEYKGVGLMSFSATFKTNVSLPLWIGLGKSSSLNHGIITPI